MVYGLAFATPCMESSYNTASCEAALFCLCLNDRLINSPWMWWRDEITLKKVITHWWHFMTARMDSIHFIGYLNWQRRHADEKCNNRSEMFPTLVISPLITLVFVCFPSYAKHLDGGLPTLFLAEISLGWTWTFTGLVTPWDWLFSFWVNNSYRIGCH